MFFGRFCKRPHCSWHQLANSSQQPTRGRSLAQRFRASFCATLRVALPDREGRARLSERTLGRLNARADDPSQRYICAVRLPQTLWHYTDHIGLTGILESSILRLGDTRFVNDRTEHSFARLAI